MICAAPFLFGKLPSHGDFVSRGLDGRAIARWDERCSAALADARRRLGPEFEDRYEATPPRGFLLGPDLEDGRRRIGCAVPSRDRVGRAFPFVMGTAMDGVGIDGDAAIVTGLEACLYDVVLGRCGPDEAIARMSALVPEDRPASGLHAAAPLREWDMAWIGAATDATGDRME